MLVIRKRYLCIILLHLFFNLTEQLQKNNTVSTLQSLPASPYFPNSSIPLDLSSSVQAMTTRNSSVLLNHLNATHIHKTGIDQSIPMNATSLHYPSTKVSNGSQLSWNHSAAGSISKHGNPSKMRISGSNNVINALCPQQSSFAYTNIDMEPIGSGIQYAATCLSQVYAWLSASMSWSNSLYTSTPVSTSVVVKVSTYTGPVVPVSFVYSLCDRFPRIYDEFTPELSTTQIITTTTTSTSMKVFMAPGCTAKPNSFPVAKPSCSFPESDCSGLPSSLQSYLGSYVWNSFCSDPSLAAGCGIAAANVRLLYWPETQVGVGSCDGEAGLQWSTLPAPSGTRIITTNINSSRSGSANVLTMTSPSVYLVMSGVHAFHNMRGKPGDIGVEDDTGTRFIDTTVVSLLPSDLKSIEFHLFNFSGPWQSEVAQRVARRVGSQGPGLSNVPKPYDLLNLQRPAPASAYFAAQQSMIKDTTVWNSYNPYISPPPQVVSMDPAWASCSAIAGMYDPPEPILSTNFGAVTPSAEPVRPPATPAAPAASPTPPVPVNTNLISSATAASDVAGRIGSMLPHLPQPTTNDPPGDPSDVGSESGSGEQTKQSQDSEQDASSASNNNELSGSENDPGSDAPSSDASAPSPDIDDSGSLPSASSPSPLPANIGDSNLQAIPSEGSEQSVEESNNIRPPGSTGNNASPATPGSNAGSVDPSDPTAGTQKNSGDAQNQDSMTQNSPPEEQSFRVDVPLVTHEGAGSANSEASTSDALATMGAVFSPATGSPPITVLQQANPGGQLAAVIGTQTVQPGAGAATVGSVVFHMGGDGAVIASDDLRDPTTLPMAWIPPEESPTKDTKGAGGGYIGTGAILSFANDSPLTVTAGSTAANGQLAAVVSGNTLIAGGPAATDHGATLSLDPQSRLEAVDEGATSQVALSALLPPASSSTSSTAPGQQPLIASRTTITGADGKKTLAAVVGGQTLPPQAVVTASGHVFSLGADGQAVVIDWTQTSQISSPPTGLPGGNTTLPIPGETGVATVTTSAVVVTGLDGRTTREVVADGTTLMAGGPAVAVGGRLVSLASGGSFVVDGSGSWATSTRADDEHEEDGRPMGTANVVQPMATGAKASTSGKKKSEARKMGVQYIVWSCAGLVIFFGLVL